LDVNEQLKNISEDLSTKRISPAEDSVVLKKFRIDEEYARRDKAYTALLGDYILQYKEKSKGNKWYKRVFFVCVMAVFACVVVIPIVLATVLVIRKSVSLPALGVAIGTIASSISALVILPRIIAEHLFPKNEDQNMIALVQKMQENDSRIRDAFLVATSEQEN
jgi:hypothetical protein